MDWGWAALFHNTFYYILIWQAGFLFCSCTGPPQYHHHNQELFCFSWLLFSFGNILWWVRRQAFSQMCLHRESFPAVALGSLLSSYLSGQTEKTILTMVATCQHIMPWLQWCVKSQSLIFSPQLFNLTQPLINFGSQQSILFTVWLMVPMG